MSVESKHNSSSSQESQRWAFSTEATYEKWRRRNEQRLLKHSSNPDAVQTWWRNIWKEQDIAKLAHHNGQPQLDGKILDEVYQMLPTDLRRDIDQQNKKLHRDTLPTLNGQQTLRMWYDSLEGPSHEKKLYVLEKFFM